MQGNSKQLTRCEGCRKPFNANRKSQNPHCFSCQKRMRIEAFWRGDLDFEGGIRVDLTRGYFAVVDREDAERVLALTWSAGAKGEGGYVCATAYCDGKTVNMHTFIFGPVAKGNHVDHIDTNPLNCRRSNLREATPKENASNRNKFRSGKYRFRGISHNPKATKPWQAHLVADGKRHCSPQFATEEEAARAYDELAVKHHGEFARLNFPKNKAAYARTKKGVKNGSSTGTNQDSVSEADVPASNQAVRPLGEGGQRACAVR
jgi:hypothetical protein